MKISQTKRQIPTKCNANDLQPADLQLTTLATTQHGNTRTSEAPRGNPLYAPARAYASWGCYFWFYYNVYNPIYGLDRHYC